MAVYHWFGNIMDTLQGWLFFSRGLWRPGFSRISTRVLHMVQLSPFFCYDGRYLLYLAAVSMQDMPCISNGQFTSKCRSVDDFNPPSFLTYHFSLYGRMSASSNISSPYFEFKNSIIIIRRIEF